VTALAAIWRTVPVIPLSWYRRLRAAHPARVLRWLRNGVLAAIAATALLYLLVAIEARREITAARHTAQAISDIGKASTAANDAQQHLTKAFRENVTLIGTGTAFTNDTAQVNTDVTLAAEGNAAGPEGSTQIQFVQGQLTTCIQLANTAVQDYDSLGAGAAQNALDALTTKDEKDKVTGAYIADTGGLIAALRDLQRLEQGALDAQLGSRWLDPAWFWLLLLGPVTGMLLLVAATGYVLAQHFRRPVSRLLASATLVTTAVSVTVGILSMSDDHQLSADPWAGHPATAAITLLLLTAAAVLAYLGYRPRLAEYRFRPS
jgi:hypothetical protein